MAFPFERDNLNLERLIQRERAALKFFFGKNIEVPWPNFSLRDLERWQVLKLDPHYLPKAEMGRQKNFSGWQKKPHQVFYKKIQEGKISQDAISLPGRWILIDCRPKPEKCNPWLTSSLILPFDKFFKLNLKEHFKKFSKQQYQNDFLLPILKKNGWKSRFCVSWNDYRELRPEITRLVGLTDKNQVRLPRFIEFNFLGNIFYPEWSETQTWEWLEDSYGKFCHLATGSFSFSVVGWDDSDFFSTILGFRPLIEL